MKKTFCDICHKEMTESESNFTITFTELLDWNPKLENVTTKKVFDDVCQKDYAEILTFIEELSKRKGG